MSPIIIPNFSRRNEFIQMLAERKTRLGVEVGTDHGVYAKQLLQGIPRLTLYCVDPWSAYTEGDEVKTDEDVENIYQEAKERLKPYNAIFMRMTSMEGVKKFDDNDLDFVFIDGNHSYGYVLEDITKWAKKVKPGGIICGHDYKEDPERKYGVIEAVQKYVTDNHIAPWFILQKKGLVDCWMFIKK